MRSAGLLPSGCYREGACAWMRAMPTRRASLILPLLALPALIGCGGGERGEPPLDEAALKVVVAKPARRWP